MLLALVGGQYTDKPLITGNGVCADVISTVQSARLEDPFDGFSQCFTFLRTDIEKVFFGNISHFFLNFTI